MIRLTDLKDAYAIDMDGKRYIVSLSRLKNDANGNARYSGTIVADDGGAVLQGHTYSFTGHGMPLREEATWVLRHHLGKI